MRTVSPFAWLICSFIGYFAAYGVVLPFLPIWLKSYHYSEETIGVVVAFSFLFRFIGSMLFSQWVKRPSALISMLRLISWSSLGLVLAIAVSSEVAWLLIALIWLFNAVFGAGIPLTDALAGNWQKQVNLDYGKARLTGSLAFIGANLLGGYILGIFGDQSMIWLVTALLLAYGAIQLLSPNPYPRDPNANPQSQQAATRQTVSYKTILANRQIVALLSALALIQGAHAAYYAYGVLYWAEMGIGVELSGWLWGTSVAAEVLVFFFAGRLLKNCSLYSLLMFTSLVAVLRWIGMGLAEHFLPFLLLQTLHGITFALCHFVTIRYIAGCPSSYIAKLQALYNGVCSCLSVALFMLFAGVVYRYEPAWSFYLMALLVLPAFVLLQKVKYPQRIEE
ncbi:MFS transporter, PPP family, 3-phenylpropionic acid transporter [Pasteurella testudinis DSM 23072]|uniref:MFS transporter, PPP family, 3-phenylpropionic acid transporter n=1 Tax=Pasteurella testudinis DSM 23072 TaxID=1122938 RepID=A0A1W1V3S9_9PAST|nr:3-phenylpropionate MFS transporter [Pasteurella testudinis]SMB87701.1 MFS transporter, PPP family, 3-phenylpropionic acid transporter [Pasteurella testudinis DSM 23072]SUB50460.1 3-phenylpropionic acid transporter [Pasteurella testudinis]